MTANTIALVVGATGGIGGEVARVLIARGWQVRGLSRDPARAAAGNAGIGIEWVKGDAMNTADVVAAARGANLVVHGANPPGYQNWASLALPMLESSIAAAKAAGARILFPGTVYNYGPDVRPLVTETSAQNPTTRKGKIRVAMEQRLQRAAAEGTPVIIVRAGDFFGPRVGNSWFSQAIVKAGRPITSIAYPGVPHIGHDWAYLPDLAETMVRVVERADELPAFAGFNFRGHFFERGIEIAEAVRDVVGKADMPIKPFAWWIFYAGAPFVGFFREVLEMRYLWTERLELDNSKLVAFLGEEPHTPLDQALRDTLKALGCLPGERAPALKPAASVL
ncbi:NAD-dependent epimerase/dehydratase family protein [Kaistia dalseonensis]|uniref:Nucleoside-diphosphate-sugar epimerase n=1 Tax=Kaistia dalseonensis TaxID=410840 RepID=A0ABU0HAZ2_9HYPH|nr:NAD-dependent epimerase/dehydratase family protein [Kaistia dalseonensis]MCX5496412.1 NAD-dependent epimerase/dehydratase family protein [Kaistia dalseonensis]MDQ0439033.1 nucleoside-diphosphate-sugar epimerase [Kaistia dalseonensis]